VLTRTTAILAGLFFVTSLFLSILASFDRKPRSMLDGGAAAPASAPAAPGVPPAGGTGSGGVLDALRGGGTQPQPPAGPQVPRSQ
jgi:preprotein translocase subunit SecG